MAHSKHPTKMKQITKYSIGILAKNPTSAKQLSKKVTKKMVKTSPKAEVRESNVQRRIYDAMLILRGINFVEMNKKKVSLTKKINKRYDIPKERMISKINKKRKNIREQKKLHKILLEMKDSINSTIERNMSLQKCPQYENITKIPIQTVCMYDVQKLNQEDQLENVQLRKNIVNIKGQNPQTIVHNVLSVYSNQDILSCFPTQRNQ